MSKKPATVSVVIPAYNCAAFISETLDSVFAQTVPVSQVVVVNDGSPDTPDLERVLQRYSGRIDYLKQSNKGVSAARNTALQATTQPFIGFVDSDDLWLPTFVERHLAMFEADPTLDLVYGNGRRFGDSPSAGRLLMDISPSEGEPCFERLVRLQCNVNTACMARREILFKAGLYDETMPTAEDFDLWVRVVKAGGKIGYHRDVTMLSRLRPGSLSDHQHWMYRDFLRVLAKWENSEQLTPAERIAIEEQQVNYYARQALYEGKKHLLEGNSPAAVAAFTRANAYLSNWKLSAVIVAVKVAPLALRSLYRWRNRYVFGSESLR